MLRVQFQVVAAAADACPAAAMQHFVEIKTRFIGESDRQATALL